MSRKLGFTLAEVLITLGIIGVVAAITLPMLIQNYQKTVLKSQFKKVYSEFFNAIKLAQSKNEAPVYCYYWQKSPYPSVVCMEYDSKYGTCSKWAMPDGSPLPSNYNGIYNDCVDFFYSKLFGHVLKYAKHCKNNALLNGCLTEQYRGVDKIKAEIDDSVEYNPNMGFSDSVLKQTGEAWVLIDGTVIVKWCGYMCETPIFMVDINGHKRPNKWGYDIFSFIFRGTENNGITELAPYNYFYEEGGFSDSQMLWEAYR